MKFFLSLPSIPSPAQFVSPLVTPSPTNLPTQTLGSHPVVLVNMAEAFEGLPADKQRFLVDAIRVVFDNQK